MQRTCFYSADIVDSLERGVKRLLDVMFSGISLIILSPFTLLIAILIKIDSPGPVFYQHIRIGKDGKPFHLYKFRSMAVGGDDRGYVEYLIQLIESDQRDPRNGIPYRKMEGDARITQVGGFLRTHYLDELPQLWNIIKGEMSLVGPRPHIVDEVSRYTAEQRHRLSVCPGATGLWQVEGKADCTFYELIDLDLDYIDNWSLGRDFQIMLKTIVLMGRGGEGFWARKVKHIPHRGATYFTNQQIHPSPSSVLFDPPSQNTQEEEKLLLDGEKK